MEAIWVLLGLIGLMMLIPFWIFLINLLFPLIAIATIGVLVIKLALYMLFGRVKNDQA
jgi:hypothetical protein